VASWAADYTCSGEKQERPVDPPLNHAVNYCPMSGIHVESTVEIDRPAGEVFAFISDVRNNPRFQNGMRSCVWTSAPPVGVGSTYDQVAAFLGRQIVSKFVIDEFEPGRRIRFRSTAGPLGILERRTVTPLGPSRCSVEVILDGDPGSWFKWTGPFLQPMVSRSVKADYRRLKAVLEGESAARGGALL
jgi:uncharacterized membrane protein